MIILKIFGIMIITIMVIFSCSEAGSSGGQTV